jgi:hypothetical protein
MVDYTREILALKKAIGSGAKNVTFDGRSIEFPSFQELLARLSWLEAQQAELTGSPINRPGSVVTTFSRDEF